MHTTENFRKYAAYCLQMARETSDPHRIRLYLSMANTLSSLVRHDDAVVVLVAKWEAEDGLRRVVLPFPSGVKKDPAIKQL